MILAKFFTDFPPQLKRNGTQVGEEAFLEVCRQDLQQSVGLFRVYRKFIKLSSGEQLTPVFSACTFVFHELGEMHDWDKRVELL